LGNDVVYHIVAQRLPRVFLARETMSSQTVRGGAAFTQVFLGEGEAQSEAERCSDLLIVQESSNASTWDSLQPIACIFCL
jgi:hypothetical protein